jgi:sugar/nucleoside kinase (ribokinase family)
MPNVITIGEALVEIMRLSTGQPLDYTGESGCSICYNGKQLDVPGFVVEEIDPTGAGDCFSAALIAGLEAGWPLDQVGLFRQCCWCTGCHAARSHRGCTHLPSCQAITNH